MITVYKLPMCSQCTATTNHMDKLGIEYETVDLSEDPVARALVKDTYGFTSAPVVVTDDDAWSMYKPDKIKGLVK